MGDLFYLHEYAGGQPDTSRSCGFVKFSRKGGWLVNETVSISINIKGVYSHKTAKENVYALVGTDGKELGAVRLNEIYVENGFCRAEFTVDSENMSQSGFDWDDTVGIMIMPDNPSKAVAAFWDGEYADLDNIVYGAARTSKAELPEISDDIEYRTEENAVHPETYEDVKPPEAETYEDVKLSENKSDREDRSILNDVRGEDAGGMPEDMISAEEIGLAPITPQTPDISRIFEKINGNMINAFDDDQFYDCMEVTPEQLQQLTDINVSENSFLMHGFYTFRHLLIAKVQDDPEALFVGVPGIYNNRERFMASMFNFNNFKRSHRSDCRNPHFGYWYQAI